MAHQVVLEVARDDLRRTRVVAPPGGAPADGEVLLRVERFGCSANNITYGVLGEQLGYWSVFPAERGWGRVPVWGFGTVVESRHADLAPGARVFGYVPMATHVVLTPDRVDGHGLVDAAAHRAALSPAYNAYRRVGAQPAARDDQQLLLRPLFFLSFLVDDHLASRDDVDGAAAVLTSASSKTSLGLAFLLAERGVEVVGLTSSRNAGFVESLQVFSRVATYDDVGELQRGPSVLVDMAGHAGVRAAVHERLGDRLRASILVGATHRERLSVDAVGHDGLPGPAPSFFFTPDHLLRRVRELGRLAFEARMAVAWDRFVEWCETWLSIERRDGPRAVEEAYAEVLEGRVAPAAGYSLSMRPASLPVH